MAIQTMYRIMILMLCSALLAGCANSTRYTEAALSWESAPTHMLLSALGNPTFFYPAEDRGDILFWHFKKEAGLTSYVQGATEKLLGKNRFNGTETTGGFVETNAYDCQIVATLSDDGATVKKIDVLAEGNCDMLQVASYNQLASNG